MKDNLPSNMALVVALLVIVGGSANSKSVPPGLVPTQIQLLKQLKSVIDDVAKRKSQEKGLLAYYIPFWLLTNHIFARVLQFLVHVFVIPNFLEGLGFRKLFMERSVRAMLSNKNPPSNPSTTTTTTQQPSQKKDNQLQVLVIAAGYDTLAYRLAQEFADQDDVYFWEIDHPATSLMKREALDKMTNTVLHEEEKVAAEKDLATDGTTTNMSKSKNGLTNLTLIAADLTQTKLQDVLSQQPNYDKSQRTIVIVEGLLYYLTEEHVKQLFVDLSQVVGVGSQVAFDHFTVDKHGKVYAGHITGIISYIVKSYGEKFHWAVHPSQLASSIFQNTPWRIKEQTPRVGQEHCVLIELFDQPK